MSNNTLNILIIVVAVYFLFLRKKETKDTSATTFYND